MSKVESQGYPGISEEKQLHYELQSAFHQFVYEQTGDESLKDSPNFLRKDRFGNIHIDSDWISAMKIASIRIGRGPGAISQDFDTGKYIAQDPKSPIGQIAHIQAVAEYALSTDLSEDEEKKLASDLRYNLVDIYNDYAGIRFNGERDIVDGRDFTNNGLTQIRGRSLKSWRQSLLARRKQFVHPALHRQWDGPKGLRTPNSADQFIDSLFHEMVVARTPHDLSQAAQILQRLLGDHTPNGILTLASSLYGGELGKMYQNFSILAEKNGLVLPKHFRFFQGSVVEFQQILKEFPSFEDGIEGYFNAANELYDGDMFKTFVNVSAVAIMSDKPMPHGWKTFSGTTTTFSRIQKMLPTLGYDTQGYIDTANQLYSGDMQKTALNISAVATMTGQSIADRWHVFPGTTEEFNSLRRQLPYFSSGIKSYLETADNLYGGNMRKLIIRLAAVAEMTGQPMPNRWRFFAGTTKDFRRDAGLLDTLTDGMNSYVDFANMFYRGDMKTAFLNISAVAEMTGQPRPKDWHVFSGSTTDYEDQLLWLTDNPTCTAEDLRTQFKYKSYASAKTNHSILRKTLSGAT